MKSVVKTLSFLVLLAAAFFASTHAHAQTVRWSPGAGTLAFNQLSELSLVFEDCEPSGTVTPPAVPTLTFSPPNRSESTSFTVINGKATRSRTITYTYRVRPTDRTPVTIPAFQIDTDKGRQPVASASFQIGDATVGQSGLSLENIAKSRFTLPVGRVWAGEVFPLAYSLNVSRRYLYLLGSDPEWDPAPLVVEPWAKPEQLETVVDNESRITVLYKTRAFAKAPGPVSLKPVTQLVNLATGSSGFTVFARPSLEQFAITSEPAAFDVRPLPAPAPAGFTGAVGKFTLDSKVVPLTATVGEPVTWTLTLEGTGNWPDIPGLPSRSLSKDFSLVQPQAKRVNKDNSLFEASITEDLVLIPTKPGSYTLGPVSFTVFNPSTGAYQTLTTKPVTLKISPAAGITTNAQHPTSNLQPSTSDPLDVGRSTLYVERSPSALPPDPLPPAGASLPPLSSRAVLIALLSTLLLPLAAWIILALRRARLTDPDRPLREAHIRLLDTLKRLAGAPPAAQPALLQSWQRDTAILFRLTSAVPTPADLNRSDIGHSSLVIGHSSGGSAAEWSVLWSEAERTLYGTADLPGNWINRALQALATRRPPAFSAFQLFLPRNLLPLLALVLFLLPGGRTVVSAAESSGERERPEAAYARADYPAAETAWRDALKTAPADWSARHNLALSLLQQNRPGEAAAHALAAFVQQPQNPSVRHTVAYAYKSAGISPPPVAQRATLTARLASLASPTRWQILLLTSAFLGALALTLTLISAYQRSASPHWSLVIGHWSFRAALGAAAFILALAAALSLHTYGPLADTRVVVVATSGTLRSIPTDLDTQKSTSLSAGTIALADKTFLGWTRLQFPDAQTGWIRTESLVPLWR